MLKFGMNASFSSRWASDFREITPRVGSSEPVFAGSRPPRDSSRRPPREVSNPYQIERGQTQDEGPIDAILPSMSRLSKDRDALRPTEDLFHELPLLLTDRVARVSSRAAVERRVAGLLRCNVR